jgi:hypothetical protein
MGGNSEDCRLEKEGKRLGLRVQHIEIMEVK